MEEYAKDNGFPIIGPLVGRFLQQIALMTSAKRIFEMGSGYGYSALWMALVLPDEGLIECTESDKENIKRGKAFLKKAGVLEKVSWHHGDALDAMSRAAGPFDMILNDVDKHQYPEALKIAWPKLRCGGVMITDNALWSGEVLNRKTRDEDTKGVMAYNKLAYALPDALSTLIPLRDGLLVSVKV